MLAVGPRSAESIRETMTTDDFTQRHTITEEHTLKLTAVTDERVELTVEQDDEQIYAKTLTTDRWPKVSTRARLARKMAETIPGITSSDARDALDEAVGVAFISDDSPLFPSVDLANPLPLLALSQLAERAGPVRTVSWCACP